jgi:hypothetical protein
MLGRKRGRFGEALRIAGRDIAGGEYNFEPAPSSLPYKPNTGTNLMYLLQGILGGMTASRHGKEAAADTADKKAYREAQIAGEAENRKLRGQEIGIEQKKVDQQAARDDRERDDKLRGIAEKVAVGSGGSVKFSDVFKALKSGNEQVMDAATNAYSTMQGLGPAGGQFFASRVAQHRLSKGEPTPDDLARIAGESADFVHKSMKTEETKANVDLGVAREKLKEAQALAKGGYLSPGQASQNGQAWLSQGTSLVQTASVEQRALIQLLIKNQGSDVAQQLMEGDAATQDDILTQLSTSPNKALAAGAKRVKELQDLGIGLMRHGADALSFAEGKAAPAITAPSVPDLSAPGSAAPGLIMPGNIDMNKRPSVRNPDGSVSSVRTISIETDQGEVLIPTVIGGRVVSNDEAIAEYKKTGKHLGIYDSPESATRAAQSLHGSEAAKLNASRKKSVAQRVREYIAGGMTQDQAIEKVAAEGD